MGGGAAAIVPPMELNNAGNFIIVFLIPLNSTNHWNSDK